MAILKHNIWKSDVLLLQIGIVRDLPIGIIRVISSVPVGHCVFIECPEYTCLSNLKMLKVKSFQAWPKRL